MEKYKESKTAHYQRMPAVREDIRYWILQRKIMKMLFILIFLKIPIMLPYFPVR